MSNGEVCCLLQICCPPDQQTAQLSSHLEKDTGCPKEYADAVASYMTERFDFAPRGTLQPLIDKIAEMARKHPKD